MEVDEALIKRVWTVIGGEGLFGGRFLYIMGDFYHEATHSFPVQFKAFLHDTKFVNISEKDFKAFSDRLTPQLELCSLELEDDNTITVYENKLEYGVLGSDYTDEALHDIANISHELNLAMLSRDALKVFNIAVDTFKTTQDEQFND